MRPVEAPQTVLVPGSEITVELARGETSFLVYSMTVESDDGEHAVVEGPYAESHDRDLGYVRLELGDRFREHYWRSRWYSIKEISDHDGERKGWYCDIARPAQISSTSIRSVDLDLDVWVSADASVVLTLDEEEFIASGIERSDPAAAVHARTALDCVVAAAHHRFVALLSPASSSE
jgi:hypothetical protein